MNDSAMQLMARERREQFLSSARDGASDIDGRPLLRTGLGLASGLVWAIVITTTVLVINMRESMPGIAQSATQASAAESTPRTSTANGHEKLARSSDSREGRGTTLASDVKRAITEIRR
jgi:hypothetical protein